jgi:thiamine pyrophosphokinase
MATKAADVLLLLNGEIKSGPSVKRLARKAGAVLCADGGARYAAKLGIIPRAVIGDMDSLPKHLPQWKSTIYICDFDPNVSDFEKALRFITRQKFQRAAKRILGSSDGQPTVWVAGALGGRLDHELVNWALLERYSEDLEIRLADGNALILGKGRHQIDCQKGATVTLLSVTQTTRVSTRGLEYPLRKGLLERSSRGLSNRATCIHPSIEIHSGRVWLVYDN